MGTGTALLVARTASGASETATKLYIRLFDPAVDIVPEISTRQGITIRTNPDVLPEGRFNIRGPELQIPGLDGKCTNEVLIAIHGWANADDGAQDKFQRARRGFESVGYRYPVIGFTWPSDTNDSLAGIDELIGFDDGKDRADRSALGFAAAILFIKRACPQIGIRLVSHSLGVRVLLQVLQRLDTDPDLTEWRENGFTIASAHLLGAAVDNEKVQINEWGGPGVQNQVIRAFSYFSGDDTILTFAYSAAEGDKALGKTGVEDGRYAPSNYTDRDLTDEIGSDHYSFWSILNDDGIVADVRAVDDVFADFAPGYQHSIIITDTYQAVFRRLPTNEEYRSALEYLQAGGTQQGLKGRQIAQFVPALALPL